MRRNIVIYNYIFTRYVPTHCVITYYFYIVKTTNIFYTMITNYRFYCFEDTYFIQTNYYLIVFDIC